MNRLLALFLTIFLALALTGCKIEDLPFINKDTQVSAEDEELKYKIDKVILSKGYQSLEPKVEVIDKNNDVSLIVSVGLLESSGVHVDQIIKNGNVINIHVVNEVEDDDVQLVVPQIILELKNTKSINMDDIKFNIVNDNFKPLSIKLRLNEVINKIINDYKLTANSSPEINLYKDEDMLVWNIDYNSIFDNNNLETPLVNLSVKVDANTGDIIEFKKVLISSYIDHGHILDYIDENLILYKKITEEADGNKLESLWYFNIKNNKKSQLYQTSQNILSAEFSPNTKNVVVLENNGITKDLYIVSRGENKAYKLLFESSLTPSIAKWYNDETIYIIQSDEKESKIYNYNIRSSKEDLISTIDKQVTGMRIFGKNFIFTEPIEQGLNDKVYHTKDWDKLTFIDNGFNPKYMGNDMVAYLKHKEENDRNHLIIYDMNKFEEYDQVDVNALSISSIPGNELLVVEKNPSVNDFTVYEYSKADKDLHFITKLNSENIFLNKKDNSLYVDLILPFEARDSEIIFSVDLTKLSNILP